MRVFSNPLAYDDGKEPVDDAQIKLHDWNVSAWAESAKCKHAHALMTGDACAFFHNVKQSALFLAALFRPKTTTSMLT